MSPPVYSPAMSSSTTTLNATVSGGIYPLLPCNGSHVTQDLAVILNCSFQALNSTALPNETTIAPGNPYILSWYAQLIYIVLFVSMVLVAAGGNIIVIWIVLANERMRTVTNYFLVNLAVADALISILNTLFNFVYMLYFDWPFGRNYCKFIQFIATCTISASVFTFMAIAIDRYMAIIHPLKPRMTASTVLGVITVIWITSAAIAFPAILYYKYDVITNSDGSMRGVCYAEFPGGYRGPIEFGYNVMVMLVTYFVPLAILCLAYIRVGLELWGSQTIGEYTTRHEETLRSKRKVVKMMIVVVLIFGICWLPQQVYFIIIARKPEIEHIKHMQHVYLCIYLLAMSNSMYNPIIYCYMNARFRKGFKYVFRWLPCIHYHDPETLSRPGIMSVRMSVSEVGGPRYERNGSMLHTVIDTLEETSYCPNNSAHNHKGGYTPATRKEKFKT